VCLAVAVAVVVVVVVAEGVESGGCADYDIGL
jgi:hypothetical protein